MLGSSLRVHHEVREVVVLLGAPLDTRGRVVEHSIRTQLAKVRIELVRRHDYVEQARVDLELVHLVYLLDRVLYENLIFDLEKFFEIFLMYAQNK